LPLLRGIGTTIRPKGIVHHIILGSQTHASFDLMGIECFIEFLHDPDLLCWFESIEDDLAVANVGHIAATLVDGFAILEDFIAGGYSAVAGIDKVGLVERES